MLLLRLWGYEYEFVKCVSFFHLSTSSISSSISVNFICLFVLLTYHCICYIKFNHHGPHLCHVFCLYLYITHTQGDTSFIVCLSVHPSLGTRHMSYGLTLSRQYSIITHLFHRTLGKDKTQLLSNFLTIITWQRQITLRKTCGMYPFFTWIRVRKNTKLCNCIVSSRCVEECLNSKVAKKSSL